ncbi:endolytic transglycosylase MltG [Bacillus marasmi]|uniref:endolytic transglycosylase MltG n=1 Tax=Bacillus marasmi TaxID=1926279 RepID=UPI0011CCAC83|nr:endolytic transglycosylase MltG [Bacillus marasmi]
MTAKTMQSIAAGIFIAACLITAVYYLFPNDAAANPKTKLSEKEMKAALVAEGYVVKTEKDWDAQVAAVEAAEKKANKAEKAANNAEKAAKTASEKSTKAKDKQKEEPKTKTETQPEEKIVYRTVIFVASGMTSIDVGNALVQSKIIPNALEFTQEVDRRGLANGLKPGMYEVQSGMTMDEIIGVIFP